VWFSFLGFRSTWLRRMQVLCEVITLRSALLAIGPVLAADQCRVAM
jgi:hypothetical protein